MKVRVVVMTSLGPEEELGERTSYEIYIVSIDGTVERLTQLEHEWVRLKNYSWSPDGKYLAFWFDGKNKPGARLTILDVEAKQVTSTCLLGEDKSTNPPDAPVWSPDGRYLAFGVFQNTEMSDAATLMMDVQQKIVFPIEKNVHPVGWMKGNE